MIKFVGGFDSVDALPNTRFPEYAFVGRSNVGKSSLINAVLGQNVARTSNTPGRTQTLNLFNVDDKIMIVDLPGYGYARVSRDVTARWLMRLEQYLLSRSQLRRLFVLIDSRIGVRPSDLELMGFCDANGIPYQVVYTKRDKRVREENQQSVSHEMHPAMAAEILETSAEKKIGIEPIRAIIGIK